MIQDTSKNVEMIKYASIYPKNWSTVKLLQIQDGSSLSLTFPSKTLKTTM